MSFLIEDDYKLQVREMDLDDITDYTDAKRLLAELAAQAEMESYLRNRYKVAVEFAKVADERNPLLVMYMIDMALYHLFSALTPRNVPQIRMDRYDAAIAWLKMVARGEVDPGLTPVDNANGETGGTSIFGSEKQNGYHW